MHIRCKANHALPIVISGQNEPISERTFVCRTSLRVCRRRERVSATAWAGEPARLSLSRLAFLPEPDTCISRDSRAIRAIETLFLTRVPVWAFICAAADINIRCSTFEPIYKRRFLRAVCAGFSCASAFRCTATAQCAPNPSAPAQCVQPGPTKHLHASHQVPNGSTSTT